MTRSLLLGAVSAAAITMSTGAFAANPSLTGGGSTLAEFDYFAEFALFNSHATANSAKFNNPDGDNANDTLYWPAGSGSGQTAFLNDDLSCDANKVTGANSGGCNGGVLETIYGASDATLSSTQISAWSSSATGQAQGGNLIQLPSMGVGVSFPTVNSGVTTNGQVSPHRCRPVRHILRQDHQLEPARQPGGEQGHGHRGRPNTGRLPRRRLGHELPAHQPSDGRLHVGEHQGGRFLCNPLHHVHQHFRKQPGAEQLLRRKRQQRHRQLHLRPWLEQRQPDLHGFGDHLSVARLHHRRPELPMPPCRMARRVRSSSPARSRVPTSTCRRPPISQRASPIPKRLNPAGPSAPSDDGFASCANLGFRSAHRNRKPGLSGS